jgi:hypothetical protein
MINVRRKSKKTNGRGHLRGKGHPGFSKKCRALGMSFKEWERRVKKVKRTGGVNPYAVVNGYCKSHRRRQRRRRDK